MVFLEIMACFKFEIWAYHLNGLLLSFQKILKSLNLDHQNSLIRIILSGHTHTFLTEVRTEYLNPGAWLLALSSRNEKRCGRRCGWGASVVRLLSHRRPSAERRTYCIWLVRKISYKFIICYLFIGMSHGLLEDIFWRVEVFKLC